MTERSRARGRALRCPGRGPRQTSLVAVAEMTPLAGGVPIVIDGQIVGAVGVSGAANAQQDEELATLAAAAVK